MSISLLTAFLCLSLLPSVQSASGCPKVECSVSLPNQVCYEYDKEGGVFNIGGCGSNEICEFNQMESTGEYEIESPALYCRANSYQSSLKFPGEKCVVKQQCRSGLCQDGLCVGLSINSPCTDFGDCAVSLVCIRNRCQFQRMQGYSCDTDNDCVNDSLCFQGKCERYFSKEIGAFPVENSFLCSTGYAENGVCKQAPANQKNPDSSCSGNTDCPLTNGKDGMCYCGMNTEGMAFCDSQPGDSEFTSYRSAFLQVLNSSLYCHYNISFSRRCPAQEENQSFGVFLNARYIYEYRAVIIGAPSCVLGVMPFALNYPYAGVTLLSGGGTSSTVVIVVSVCVFSVLLLLGVVCFLCVRKYAIRETLEQRLQMRIRSGEYAHIDFIQGRTAENQGENAPQYETMFSIKDLVLSEKDRSFLAKGIPIARAIDMQTNETTDQLEIGLPLAYPQEAKGESRVGSATDTALFYPRDSK